MGHLPNDLSSGVHALAGRVKSSDLMKPAFEEGEQPHVTVLYGLHTNDPSVVYKHLKKNRAIRPATLRLGKLDLFRHRDQDVLKVNVESPDLDHLHSVTKDLPNSFSFPSYNPHVTVAYLKPGTGEKYLGLSNPLQGREVTIGGLVFSDNAKNYSYLPLRASQVTDAIELCANWGFRENDIIEMTTAMAVGTMDRPFGLSRPIFPSFKPKSSPSKRSRTAQPEAWDPQPSRKLNEGFDLPDQYVLPQHLQVMNELEAHGWRHFDDGPRHAHFLHESVPDIYVHVIRRDEQPLWNTAGKMKTEGTGVSDLQNLLKNLQPLEVAS